MVCPRCVTAVRRILEKHGLTVISVTLGEAVIAEAPDAAMKNILSAAFEAEGFELLDDPRSALVENIKSIIIEWVRMECERNKLSAELCRRLNKDYGALSKLFSEVRGMTIERYCILQRVEYAKELLCYSEKTTSEIAWHMGYSSPAHLSSQFKQVTGLSPRDFRELHCRGKAPERRFIDEL